ncbi:MAG: hypothetical protein B5M51_06890 [Anaerolinea sp. 4484_236]|nr:MAG: hypothetical protein B5M51_06890 [Anaerolinea sp. 4484_236]OQY35901.1 MAG: hypothetical protein B6243_04185 [Anaerolineaceae bacterium 4572_5.2]
MDYSEIIEILKEASSFDLHRLQVAINQQLESPQRTEEIRRRLKLGQRISYFDERENRLIEAKIIKLKRTRVLVEHISDKERWNIPFYYINLDDVDTAISISKKTGLEKSQLSVGDVVGFQDKQNNDVYGKIIRLNQKTVSLVTDTNAKWRVGYKFLYLVIDGEKKDPNLKEGQILDL